MPLLLQDKVQIRRHLNFPLAGLSIFSPGSGILANGSIAYRYFQSYGQLEARMNQLAPSEEAVLLGTAYAAVGFNTTSLPVAAGSVITVTLSNLPLPAVQQFSVPIVLTYTVLTTDTLLTICGALAFLAAQNVHFTSSGAYSVNDYGTQPYSQNVVPFPITSFIAPNPYTITCTGTGGTLPQIVANGSLQHPVIYIEETYPATPVYGYLPILNRLEAAFGSSTNNLSVTKAREATLRASELRERQWLYQNWQGKLAQFMGVGLDPHNVGASVSPYQQGGGPLRLGI